MTPSDNPNDLARSTQPTAAGPVEAPDGKRNVYLLGYASNETGDVLRLYQGLGVTQFYEIPKDDIVNVTHPPGVTNSSLVQVLLPSTTRITYVSSRKVTLPAGSLAALVEARRANSPLTPLDKCPNGCTYLGVCHCLNVDHWLNLKPEKAKELGVVALDTPASS